MGTEVHATAAEPPGSTRLTACPDCGGTVSTLAPVCIHCGRPLAPSAARKPMAGIVVALLLAVASIVLWVLVPASRESDGMRALQWFGRISHLLGNAALIAGALMSLGGNRRGNAVVRVTSAVMIPVVVAAMMIAMPVFLQLPPPDGGYPNTFGELAPRFALITAIGTAPWWLYLFLFRRSRYP